MFSYFLKLFVCLFVCVCVCACVCVRVCVCVHACMKVEAFSVSRYSLWSMFPLSLLWCDVMSVRPLSSRTPESMYFHQCRSAWLWPCSPSVLPRLFSFPGSESIPPVKRNNVLSPNSAPQSGRCRRSLWPCRPHFGEHSVIKGTLLVSDNMHFVGCVGNARLGLLVKYLTSYI